jgi:hypothetical protein
MKLSIMFLLLSGLSALGQSKNFKIDLISPGRSWLYVDDAWQEGAECIEAKVSVSKAADAKGVAVKAYFYSSDGKLQEIVNQPTPQADGNANEVKLPAKFEIGKKYSFLFAVPKAVKSGTNKWKRVVVVFGTQGSEVAKVYPKDDLEKFEFPEKKSISQK